MQAELKPNPNHSYFSLRLQYSIDQEQQYCLFKGKKVQELTTIVTPSEDVYKQQGKWSLFLKDHELLCLYFVNVVF